MSLLARDHRKEASLKPELVEQKKTFSLTTVELENNMNDIWKTSWNLIDTSPFNNMQRSKHGTLIVAVAKEMRIHSMPSDQLQELVKFLRENVVGNDFSTSPEQFLKKFHCFRKDKIGIDYPIILAQYGTDDKTKAQEKLPMLKNS